MALTKAELENHRNEYYACIRKTRSALEASLYREAVEYAMASCPHIDGMMQYESKYEDREFTGIEAMDLVLKYAPLIFDSQSLDGLETLLRNQRRIAKNTADDLAGKLSTARKLMWDAHRLWSHLELLPDARQDELRGALGGDQDRWRSVAETWEKMEILHRKSEGVSYRLAFATQMDRPSQAKCPSCGAVGKAPKVKLLDEVICPKCRAKVLFVFIS